MKILVTGGSGFIGSNFIRHILQKYPEAEVINYSKTESKWPSDFQDGRYKFFDGDVLDFPRIKKALEGVDCLVHLAAESNVDCFSSASDFTKTNALGTHVLLEAAKSNKLNKIIILSTSEVYGESMIHRFIESDSPEPNSFYAMSKLNSEIIALFYKKYLGLPVVVIRPSNIFGPRQSSKNIIPKFILNLLSGKKVPLYGKGDSCRSYLFIDDLCRALDLLIEKGKPGEIYNVGSREEISNLDLTKIILKKIQKDESYIEHVNQRDFDSKKFPLNTEKLAALGWKEETSFNDALDKTILWYKENLLLF